MMYKIIFKLKEPLKYYFEKNTNEVIINQNGTRMVKDGED